MVTWMRAVAWSAPFIVYHTEPNSGLTRVPSFSAASAAALPFSGIASNFRFCTMRGMFATLEHCTANGCCPGWPERSLAHQAVGAGLQRVVGAVGFELDDGGAGFQVAGRRGQRLLDAGSGVCANMPAEAPAR
jgi:hypothetical protein